VEFFWLKKLKGYRINKGPGKNGSGQPLPPTPRVDQRPPERGRGDKRGGGSPKK